MLNVSGAIANLLLKEENGEKPILLLAPLPYLAHGIYDSNVIL